MDYRKADLETRLAMAQAQDTSLEILQQLATDEVEAVRRAIALNPNADEALLRSLGKAFPEEVIQNPVFGLLLLENPKSDFVLLSQARSVSASAELLERCAQSNEEEVLIAVGGNPKTLLSVLEQLVNEPPVLSGVEYAEREDYQDIFTAIAENPATSPQLLQKIVEQWGVAKYAVARNPKTPVELLKKFSTWRNREMLLAVAQNPAAPTAIIESLAIEEYEAVREIARSHPNAPANIEELTRFIERQPGTPPELLEKLASSKSGHVRYLVAKHPKTPATALEILAQDDEPKVAERAGCHSNVSEKALVNYAKFLVKQRGIVSPSNQSMYERKAVDLVRHPKITTEALEALALFGSSSMTLDIAISRSQVTSEQALKSLFQYFLKRQYTGNDSYMFGIVGNPSFPQDLWPEVLKNHKFLSGAACNSNLPLHIMRELIETGDESILRNLAQNKSTPSELLLRLTDESVSIRRILAQNPNAPVAVLEALANDDHFLVRQEVAKNNAITSDILSNLLKDEEKSVVFSTSYSTKLSAKMIDRLIEEILAPSEDFNFMAASAQQRRHRKNLQEQRFFSQLNIAAHANSSKDTLRRLIDYNDFRIHFAMLERLDIDGETIQLIVERAIEEMRTQKKTDFCKSVLKSACKHPNTPSDILTSFANNQPEFLKDAFGEMLFLFLREGVAQNPSTPLSVLETLRKDKQGRVQEAAIQSILMR